MKLHNNFLLKSIAKIAKDTPDKIALIESNSGNSIYYKDLYRKSLNYSKSISQKGFKKGDRILILAPGNIELIAFILGCSTLGIIPVLADPAMGRQVMNGRIEFIKSKAVLVPKIIKSLIKLNLFSIARRILKFELPDLHKLNKKLISLDEIDSGKVNDEIEFIDSNPSEDLVIIFTSGTTSTPKAVVHSEKSMSGIISRVEKILDKNIDVIFSDQAYITFPALVLGKTVVLNETTKSYTSEFTDQILHKYNVQSFFTNPYKINQLNAYYTLEQKRFPESLNSIYIGSAPVTLNLLDRLRTNLKENTNVYCVYGMTEVLPVAISKMEEKIKLGDQLGDYLGEVFDDIKIKISDENELMLGGDIFERYEGESKLEWFETGDIVKLDNKRIFLKSRKKDMIINDSYNIYPQIYESIIEQIEGINQSAMVGVYSELDENEKIVLFVVRSSESSISKPEILKKLKNGKFSIDKYALPEKIIFVEELPVKGRSNKVDKSKLREIASKAI